MPCFGKSMGSRIVFALNMLVGCCLDALDFARTVVQDQEVLRKTIIAYTVVEQQNSKLIFLQGMKSLLPRVCLIRSPSVRRSF